MYVFASWLEVLEALSPLDWRTSIPIDKSTLPHPLDVGMTKSVGLPEGQIADYRYLLEGGSGLHIKDFGSHFTAHLDEVHPAHSIPEHLRQDAPALYIAGAALTGALAGFLSHRLTLTKPFKSALVGAFILGGLGLFSTIIATKDDQLRQKPS